MLAETPWGTAACPWGVQAHGQLGQLSSGHPVPPWLPSVLLRACSVPQARCVPVLGLLRRPRFRQG